jgi:hypothetical protein
MPRSRQESDDEIAGGTGASTRSRRKPNASGECFFWIVTPISKNDHYKPPSSTGQRRKRQESGKRHRQAGFAELPDASR